MISFQGETRIVIQSSLYKESRKFYEDILELTIAKEWDRGTNDAGVIYQMGDAYIEILQRDTGSIPGSLYLYSRIDNIEQAWKTINKKMGSLEPIQDQSWGHKTFTVTDPNGFMIRCFSLLA